MQRKSFNEYESSLSSSRQDVDVYPTIPAKPPSFGELPGEILVLIFGFLSVQDLLSCSVVCSTWHSQCFTSFLWQRLYWKEFASWATDRLGLSQSTNQENDILGSSISVNNHHLKLELEKLFGNHPIDWYHLYRTSVLLRYDYSTFKLYAFRLECPSTLNVLETVLATQPHNKNWIFTLGELMKGLNPFKVHGSLNQFFRPFDHKQHRNLLSVGNYLRAFYCLLFHPNWYWFYSSAVPYGDYPEIKARMVFMTCVCLGVVCWLGMLTHFFFTILFSSTNQFARDTSLSLGFKDRCPVMFAWSLSNALLLPLGPLGVFVYDRVSIFEVYDRRVRSIFRIGWYFYYVTLAIVSLFYFMITFGLLGMLTRFAEIVIICILIQGMVRVYRFFSWKYLFLRQPLLKKLGAAILIGLTMGALVVLFPILFALFSFFSGAFVAAILCTMSDTPKRSLQQTPKLTKGHTLIVGLSLYLTLGLTSSYVIMFYYYTWAM
jgi:hypothetical protein